MRFCCRLILSFLLLGSALPLLAANPHIINLLREDYRADNKNWAIGQDELGVMYFGNDIGLLEFDGIEWKLNSMSNSLTIRSLAVLSHKTIFTGSYEEFGRWDRDLSGSLVYTSLSDSIDRSLLNNGDFWKIWITNERVYFQSFASIFVYDYKSVHRIPANHGFLFLSKVGDDFLVQQMRGSLCWLRGESLEVIPGSEFLRNTDVRVLLPHGEEQYLIGTSTMGVYLYDGKTFREWNPAFSRLMKDYELNFGLHASNGNYFFGTILDGIYETDAEGRVLGHVSSENYLQNNTILALYEDNQQNIWAALDRGISYIQYKKQVDTYTDPGGKTGAIYGATIWKDKLFLATNQGVFYIDRKAWGEANALSRLQLINGTQGQAWTFKVVDDKLYCCHNLGLRQIHADLSVTKAFSIETGVYNLSEITMNGREYLLLSTYQSMKMIDKETEKVYEFKQFEEPIKDIEVDHLGNFWLEHFNRGVYRCKPEDDLSGFRQYTYYGGRNSDGLPYKLKLFKVGGRVVLLGNNRFYTYDDINNQIVPDEPLNRCFQHISHLRHVIPIGNYRYWGVTNTAIYQFVYDGDSARIVDHYNLGVDLSLVFNYENVSVLNDSVSLVCLDNGFLIYKTGKEEEERAGINEPLPAPFLESMQIESPAGQVIHKDPSKDDAVPYNFNTLTFRFMAKDVFSKDLSFQFILENVDVDWSAPRKVNRASYARLPQGTYVFKVRTVDNLGNFSEVVTRRFEVLSPWYQTYWAYLLYVLLFILVAYGIWKLILRRYRNIHLQKIRYRETKRLRDLTGELQDEVERKNAELLTQTSFIIQKNELILKIKGIIDDFYNQNKSASLIPLSKKINALLSNNLDSEEDWKTFILKFEEKHTSFFKKLKMLYPELTNNDLRLCACLKLNMETKEIASLMNLSVRAVENSRYRLRKKLKLRSTQNLNDFFLEM